MAEKNSIFDMIGPVMIGPSSSHTAGVVRIGRVARRILRDTPEEAEIIFYNSFARTYEGHGSDRAIAAGLMGMETDDERIREALEIAAKENLRLKFKAVMNAATHHPNTVIARVSKGDRKVAVTGISKGGGVISIVDIDGFKCNFSAQDHTLIITAEDVRGSIAFISNVVSNDNANIATMSVDRAAKNKLAKLVLEMDSGLEDITVEYLRHLKWVTEVNYIPKIEL